MDIHRHDHHKEGINIKISIIELVAAVVLMPEWKGEEEEEGDTETIISTSAAPINTPRHAIKMKIIHHAVVSRELEVELDMGLGLDQIGKIQRGKRKNIQPNKYTLQYPKQKV